MKLGAIPSILAAAAFAATPNAIAAQDKTQVFQPTGQWSLDYGEDYCRLARTFSDGQDNLALALERIEPGPLMRLILVSNGIKTFRSAEQIGWHFTPKGDEREAIFARSQTPGGEPYFNLGPVSVAPPPTFEPGAPPPVYDRAKEQAAAKGVEGFVLEEGLASPVRIETGDLEGPVNALQGCTDDLAKTWGLDPAKLRTQTSPAIPEGGGVGWLPQGTIPFSEFGKFVGASNQVRLMVDAEGKPTSCHVHWPTLAQPLNDKICKTLMANAKFLPAKDADGNAMTGYWVGNPQFLGPPMRGPGARRPGA